MAVGCQWFWENVVPRTNAIDVAAGELATKIGKSSGAKGLRSAAGRVPMGGPMALMGGIGLGAAGAAGYAYGRHRRGY